MKSLISIKLFLVIILTSKFTESLDNVGTINGKTFLCDPVEPVQAATAATRCQENDATLARIESYEEGRIIAQYMIANDVTYVWIDGSDYPEEGNWHWISNGQPLNYTNWAPGEPIVNLSNQCMFMDQNGWFYTYRCTSPGGDSAYHTRFLCQTIE